MFRDAVLRVFGDDQVVKLETGLYGRDRASSQAASAKTPRCGLPRRDFLGDIERVVGFGPGNVRRGVAERVGSAALRHLLHVGPDRCF